MSAYFSVLHVSIHLDALNDALNPELRLSYCLCRVSHVLLISLDFSGFLKGRWVGYDKLPQAVNEHGNVSVHSPLACDGLK